MTEGDGSETTEVSEPRPVRYIDITEFRERGYLQEVNREWLHPYGLALMVRSGWTKDEIKAFLREHSVDFGDDAIECIWTFVVTLGLDNEHLSAIWDDRDDPEGIIFADGVIDVDKATDVHGQRIVRREARVERLGYWVQPVPTPPA